MRILGIRLRNIRSYKDKAIVFPPRGITVIYGDNGTGKTSILLAITYALFGQPRRASSNPFNRYAYPKAQDLLRVGSIEGSVTLLVEHEDKLILIERRLRRTSSETVSDMGGTIYLYKYIEENGRKTLKLAKAVQRSSKDLRNEIIKLLGLPEDPKREKPIVYTSAIYVPQLNLHEIINLDEDDRTLLINKALAIDKYTVIKKNIEEIAKGRRSVIGIEKEKLERSREDLERKIEEINVEELKKKIEQLKHEIENLHARREQLVKREEELKKKIDEIEKQIDKANEKRQQVKSELGRLEQLKEELEKEERRLRRLMEEVQATNINEVKDKMKELEAKIAATEKEIEKKQSLRKELEKQMEQLDKNIEDMTNKIEGLRSKLNELKGEKGAKEGELKSIGEEIKRIKQLIEQGICPVCRQKITHQHGYQLLQEKERAKENTITCIRKLDEKIKELEKAIKELKTRKNALEKQREEFNKRYHILYDEILMLKDAKHRYEGLLVKIRNIDEIINKINYYREKVAKENILKEQDERLEFTIKSLKDELNKLRQEQDRIKDEKNRVDVQIKEKEGEINGYEKSINNYKDLNEELTKIKEEITILERMANFLYGAKGKASLYQLIELVEDRIRKTAYSKFRDLFIEYFQALMGEEERRIPDIDADFKPIFKMMENGRIYTIPQPSAGELSSASLAYRLALNAVARGMAPQLRRSTLILDEPTIGFSPERVERLRDLLRIFSDKGKLQIVIVTHDRRLLAAGDCKIRLSIDPETNVTHVTYEECNISDEYRAFIENLLYRRALGKDIVERQEYTAVSNKGFKPFFRAKTGGRQDSISEQLGDK